MHDPARAEDAAQDVFLKLWRALPLYNAQSSFSAWIYAITRNSCFNLLRRDSYRETLSLEDPAAVARHHAPAVREEVIDCRALLDQLSEKDRQLLTLFYWQDRSYEEGGRHAESPRGHYQKRLVPGAWRPVATVFREVLAVICSFWQPQILEVIDRLARVLPADLENHLSLCGSCREWLETERVVDRALSDELAPPLLPARFRSRLRQRIRSESRAWVVEVLPDLLNLAGAGSLVAVAYQQASSPAWAAGLAAVAAAFAAFLILGRSQMEEREE